ncbi:NtaA/DmoA family FMN-dependent monooxygenase [Streptomyces sp900105245]|uniref:NtaA/DmoA family FMN-dependent monooxygenase n=1 Tax=Streptomyces sp. 900105245 TaxID=3154379 RepID=A0ABV1UM11_9ACTN
MTANRFHLAWFCSFTTDSWTGEWGGDGNPWAGDFYIELAKNLERACFDYVVLEDKLMVSTAYGGTMETDLKHGIAPKHDPAPLATLMSYCTERLGIVATMSTSFYPPWMLARLGATIDHIAKGRFGWNIVTSAEDHAAQNFGMDKHHEHDHRYEMAHEYLDLVSQLWDSWDFDAVVKDRKRSVYADHKKVRTIDFNGRFYRSRGPLNTIRPPQGRPVLCQAGASPKGRDFAAKYADTIVAIGNTVPDMKAYRDDIRERMKDHGRNPDECKILYLVTPVVDETNDDARRKADRWTTDPHYIEYLLCELSSITEIDFSKFDLDEPLPAITTNGERGTLEKFAQAGSGKTLRELIGLTLVGTVDLVGSPGTVADRMGKIMEEVGGDGFLITNPRMHFNRRYITEITDGLVPALQRRGLVRTGYTHAHLRDNLLEF